MLSYTPFGTMVCMTAVSSLAVDPDRIDPDRYPSAGSFEFHNAVAVQENIEGTWGKVMVSTVPEDYVNVHMPCYIQGCLPHIAHLPVRNSLQFNTLQHHRQGKRRSIFDPENKFIAEF